ncbi:MAG: hypothetical protein DMG32_16305 [Acidobacteria bacterium]|nr:MAG: hypothetical protein DMG32_16305 [Acidobacteriota bacterium]
MTGSIKEFMRTEAPKKVVEIFFAGRSFQKHRLSRGRRNLRRIGLNSELDPSTERRTAQRFRVKLPMTVRWPSGSLIAEAQTECQDISTGGVYFFLSKQPQDGSLIEIVVTLPHHLTQAGRIDVRCQALVQRTEIKKRNLIGVAAKIERYELLHRNTRPEDARDGSAR